MTRPTPTARPGIRAMAAAALVAGALSLAGTGAGAAGLQFDTGPLGPAGGFTTQRFSVVNGDPVACKHRDLYFACKSGCGSPSTGRIFSQCRSYCERWFCL